MSTSIPDFTPKSSYIYEESPGISEEEYLRLVPERRMEEFPIETLTEYSALLHELDFLVTYLRPETKVVINSKVNLHYRTLVKLFPELNLDLWTKDKVRRGRSFRVHDGELTAGNSSLYVEEKDLLYISYNGTDETELIRTLKPRAALLILPELAENYTYFRGYILAPYLISCSGDEAYAHLQLERMENGSYEQCRYDVNSIKAKLSYRDLAVKKQVLFYNNLDRSSVVFTNLTKCTLEVCRILWLFWRYFQFFSVPVSMEASVISSETMVKFIESEIPNFSLFDYAKGAVREETAALGSSVKIPANIQQIQALLLAEEELVVL